MACGELLRACRCDGTAGLRPEPHGDSSGRVEDLARRRLNGARNPQRPPRKYAEVTRTPTILGVVRILAALGGTVAVIGDFNYALGGNPLAIANFFSYFTVQSAIIGIIVLTVSGVRQLRGRPPTPRFDMLRVISVCWMVVSGVVFAVILSEGAARGLPVWAPWSSQVMHFWMPAIVLADWLLTPHTQVRWTALRPVVAFPFIWVIYTMIRGSLVQWYPYFFLDPALVDIPFELGFCLLIVAALFTGVAAALIGASRRVRVYERFHTPQSLR